MLSETCFEIDFNFLDGLSNIGDCRSVTRGKDTNPNGNLNSFDFSFSVDSAPNYKSTTSIENDVLDDDLCALLESCHIQNQKHQPSGITSSTSLGNDYLSNNLTSEKKHEKIPSSSIGTSVRNGVSEEIQLLDCLEDILFEVKCDDHNQICSENQLNLLKWEQSSINDSKVSELNNMLEPNNGTVDDEIIPDINLNFCLKKNINDKFSPMSTSPESMDSGFDEIDFSEKSDTCSSDETSSLEATFGKCNLKKPTLIGSKQSLLSRALSAQPRTGKSQKEKLQNVRKELLQKCVTKSVFEHNRDQHQEMFENIIDQSAQFVIKSNFLTIPGQ